MKWFITNTSNIFENIAGYIPVIMSWGGFFAGIIIMLLGIRFLILAIKEKDLGDAIMHGILMIILGILIFALAVIMLDNFLYR